MRKRYVVLLTTGFLGLLFCSGSGLAAPVDPQVEVTSVDAFTPAHFSSPGGFPGKGEIDTCTEIRAVLGSPGKNIVASWSGDGDTVQIVYGRPNPGPHIVRLWYARSFNGGASWELAPSTIGPGPARRIYPGIVQLTADTSRVPYVVSHQAYQEGGNYVRSPLYFTHDESFPSMNFTPTCVNPADSATLQLWMPSITMTEDGDTILVSGGESDTTTGAMHDAYLYRSFDGGQTWSGRILMIETLGNNKWDMDCPQIHMGPGGYVFAYFHWADIGSDRMIPFYTESFDYGETWSSPCSLGVPYPGAGGWWDSYDAILDDTDNYRPHIAVKLHPGNLAFSDVWEMHPYAGGPGSWSNWQYTLLMGDPNGNERRARQPSVGMLRGTSHIYITFSYYSDSIGGQIDIGMRCSTDGGQTWDPQVYQITNDTLAEAAVELGYEVSGYLHIVYLNDDDFPTRVMHLRYPNPWPLEHDVATISIETPPDTVPCGSTYTPQATVANYGNVSETFDVSCTFDSAGIAVYDTTATVWGLGPGEMTQISFSPDWTADSVHLFDYIMTVATLLGDDSDPTNDSLQKPVTTWCPPGVEETQEAIYRMQEARLYPNEPNPFTGITTIPYRIPSLDDGRGMAVSVRIYDLKGTVVRTVVEGVEEPGFRTVVWDGTDDGGGRLACGIYFCRLTSGSFTGTNKLVVLR